MDDTWAVGKTKYKTDGDLVVEDNRGDEHTLVVGETYKADRKLWEEWNKKQTSPKNAENLGGANIRENTEEAKENTKEGHDDISENDNNIPTPKPKIKPNLDKYTKHNTRTSSGRKKIDNNDPVSEALRNCKDMDETYDRVADLIYQIEPTKKVIPQDLKDKYSHLNIGQQRMCLGNLVRGAMKRNGIETLDNM
jgi:hypothetical protein